MVVDWWWVLILSLVLLGLALRDIVEYFQLEDAEPKKHALTPEEEAKRLKEEAK